MSATILAVNSTLHCLQSLTFFNYRYAGKLTSTFCCVKIYNKHLSFLSATAEFLVILLVLYDVEFPAYLCVGGIYSSLFHHIGSNRREN